MKSTSRWIIALIGWIVLLMIFGIWRSLDKEMGTSAIIGGIRGAILGGGIYFLYHWAKDNPQKHTRRDNSAEAGLPQQGNPINLDNYYKIVAEELQSKKIEAGLLAQAIAEGNGDKNKARAIYIKLRIDELIRQSAQNDQALIKEIKPETSKYKKEESIIPWAIGGMFKGLLIGIIILYLVVWTINSLV